MAMIQVAVFCERVETDALGRKCVISIHDTTELEIEPPGQLSDLAGTVLVKSVYILVQAPDLTGAHSIRLFWTDPKGRVMAHQYKQTGTLDGLNGYEHDKPVELKLERPLPGTYMLHVEFDGVDLGSIPLLLRIKPFAH